MPPCDGRRVILLRSLADEDYWADHGLPVIRDEATDDPGPELEELLEENATDAQPGGTIATAGFGWLWAKTSGADDEHHVRLDVHGNVPPDDQSSWPDVVETPYRSDGGIVRLGWMTADGGEDPLLLGPPGLYRVRASCRRERDDERDSGAYSSGQHPASLSRRNGWLAANPPPGIMVRAGTRCSRPAGHTSTTCGMTRQR